MTEIVELVARAIEDECAGADPRDHAVFVKAARAAIAAMREPTDEMLVAAESAAPALATFASREASPSFAAWRAMIDAALKD